MAFQQRTGTAWFLIVSFFVALVAGLLYTPGLPGNFVFDDDPNIVYNQSIQLKKLTADALLQVIAIPQPSGAMRGLPTLTFALDYWRGGGAVPENFKTTNILIHAITAFALAWFFRSLLLTAKVSAERVRWMAPLMALAWAIHPLQVSTVLYAVQRLQSLGTLFLVLALLAYLQARRAQIAGHDGRAGLMAATLSWVVAMGCKEDSTLLPVYTLALELTVLRFAAADARLAKRLKRIYLIASLVGVAAYLFVVIPHYWSWGNYPGRDFSTPERLLTQARVLCMYLWQFILPLPSHMPFYYDWLQPSHGLLQPWTTLSGIVFLVALLATAWHLRVRKPLFALGVFIFFGAHFIASNVVGLELAFEHRNNFALIGAVLVTTSLLVDAAQHLQLRFAHRIVATCILLLALGSATALRAHSWSNNLLFSQATTAAAPHSARAWVLLCASQFDAGGGLTKGNARLDEAIETCSKGTALAPYALNNPALLVVLKTVKGNVTPQDWELFQRRLETVVMTPENSNAPAILTSHLRKGVRLDHQQVLKALATLSHRIQLPAFKNAEIGYFIMNEMDKPDLAIPYFAKAIATTPPNDPFPRQLGAELREKGRPDLAQEIEQLGLKKPTPSVK